MKIALLGRPRSWYVRQLGAAARERGHLASPLDFESLVGHVGFSPEREDESRSFQQFDAAIVRTMPPGSLEQVVYRMDALWRAEAAGVTVLNPPKAIECAVDKYLASVRIEAAGLPTPETIVCEKSDAALQHFESLGGDVLVKPLFGSEGRGIVRVSDRDLALRTFRTLERIGAVLYLQRFVPNEGYDVRVMVLDGRVLGAMKRRANGDFRANVSLRGVAERHELIDLEAEYAIRAARAVGARLAGVDLLWDRGGKCYVIEVNAVPGWRVFERVTGTPMADRVIQSLETSSG